MQEESQEPSFKNTRYLKIPLSCKNFFREFSPMAGKELFFPEGSQTPVMDFIRCIYTFCESRS